VYIDGGTWQGTEIVSQSWINESLQPHADLGPGNPNATWQLTGYGYQWWLGFFNFESQQVIAHAAMGFGAQNIWVIPAYNLVIANHGNNYEGAGDGQIEDLIVRYILPAMPQGN
jgi:CubicO group peptidase (beta-lactamase class C family)